MSKLTTHRYPFWATVLHRGAQEAGRAARGVLRRRRMHPLAFLHKRIHLCAVARGREMFAHVEDMTPARFDVLYAIHMGARSTAKICEWLGLARQTIWKMLERLSSSGSC